MIFLKGEFENLNCPGKVIHFAFKGGNLFLMNRDQDLLTTRRKYRGRSDRFFGTLSSRWGFWGRWDYVWYFGRDIRVRGLGVRW